MIGDKVRQGLHHGAQQSTNTDVSGINTSRAKELSVTSTGKVFCWVVTSGSRHLPHRGLWFRRSSDILFFVPHLRQRIIKSSKGAWHFPHAGRPWNFCLGIRFFVPQLRHLMITFSSISKQPLTILSLFPRKKANYIATLTIC